MVDLALFLSLPFSILFALRCCIISIDTKKLFLNVIKCVYRTKSAVSLFSITELFPLAPVVSRIAKLSVISADIVIDGVAQGQGQGRERSVRLSRLQP